MNKYINLSKKVASMFSSITFFKICLPVLLVVGSGIFLYFGMKGVVNKQTIALIDLRKYSSGLYGMQDQIEKSNPIQGAAAVVIGVLYIITACLIAFVLGPVCYFIWFSKS